jgi:hypothetical protein
MRTNHLPHGRRLMEQVSLPVFFYREDGARRQDQRIESEYCRNEEEKDFVVTFPSSFFLCVLFFSFSVISVVILFFVLFLWVYPVPAELRICLNMCDTMSLS